MSVLEEDFQLYVNDNCIEWNALKDTTIMITGISGLIGSLLCKFLLFVNDQYKLNIHVVGCGRDEKRARNAIGEIFDRDSFTFVNNDVVIPIEYEKEVHYVFHCAGVTISKQMVTQPVETILTSVIGTNNLLDYSKTKDLKSFVYLSSMEMYGSFGDADKVINEDDNGYINPLLIRSNYPESKRLCENLCVGYFNEYGVPVKIARLAQTFGAGIQKQENRVFAQFARSILRGEDIVLHTKGLSEGNYVYTMDCIMGLLTILLKGKNGEAYNITNPDSHMTIGEMANLVCSEFSDGNSKVFYDISDNSVYGYASDTKLFLSSKKLQSLGWQPRFGLKDSYKRMIDYMKEVGDY